MNHLMPLVENLIRHYEIRVAKGKIHNGEVRIVWFNHKGNIKDYFELQDIGGVRIVRHATGGLTVTMTRDNYETLQALTTVPTL